MFWNRPVRPSFISDCTYAHTQIAHLTSHQQMTTLSDSTINVHSVVWLPIMSDDFPVLV